jgi:acetyltransferase-like isoleucine patch superfamily enzyme
MVSKIARSAIIYDKVLLGDNGIVDEFVILGVTPRHYHPGELETRIGPKAFIRSHTVIYAGNTVGIEFQTGHGVMIRELNHIGDEVSIGTHSVIEHHVQVGYRVRIHSNAFVPEYSVLEDYAWVGPNVVLTNARYPRSPKAKVNLKGPHLLPGAKIGANATVLPEVVIGRNALVGAGSVVVRDVPDDKVVVGNPARVIRDVRELDAYQVKQFIQAKKKG